MDWTEERNSRLRDLWDEGLSTRAIAAALGVTKNSIVGKSYRLGLQRRCPSNRPGSAPRPQPVPAKRPERPGHPVLELRVGVCRWPLGIRGPAPSASASIPPRAERPTAPAIGSWRPERRAPATEGTNLDLPPVDLLDSFLQVRSMQGMEFRLDRSAAPAVIDLFSGCGGFSLGFRNAGFRIAGSVELDQSARATHAANFPEAAHFCDATRVDPDEVAASLAHAPFRVLVGGPPCQAYARVGRAKLRSVASRDKAHLDDPRVTLFRHWLRFVEAIRPEAVAMENVLDCLSFGGRNVMEETSEILVSLGYLPRYTILNAVHHGVPQIRDRAFLLAFRGDLGLEPTFPAPSHAHELPRGYLHSRHVALSGAGAASSRFFVKPVHPTSGLPRPGPRGRPSAIFLRSTDRWRPERRRGGAAPPTRRSIATTWPPRIMPRVCARGGTGRARPVMSPGRSAAMRFCAPSWSRDRSILQPTPSPRRSLPRG